MYLAMQILWAQGYLSAEKTVWIDQRSSLMICTIFPGPKFKISDVRLEDELIPVWQSAGSAMKKEYAPELLVKEVNKVLNYLSNRGFPYVSVNSHVLEARDSSISLELILEKGNHYVFDSLMIEGSCELKNEFVATYLGIQKNKPYSEQKVKDLDVLLDRMPLLERTRNSQVFFLKNSVWIKIYVDARNTDRLDGIIGLMPNNSVTTSRNLLITGELTLELNNLNKRAVEAGLQWRRFLKQSQSLEISCSVPLVLGSPVGVAAKADILKLDSLFLETGIDIMASIRQKSNLQWFVSYNHKTSSVFNSDTNQVLITGKLPTNHPYKSKLYGLGFELNRLNDWRNPTRGSFSRISFNLGLRNIVKDPNIERIKFDLPGGLNSIYDTMDLSKMRGTVSIRQDVFVPVFKNFTGLIGYNGSYIFGEDILFSEQIREGGMNSLRGFDERSIFAYNFTMFTIELRYLLDGNSWFGIFANGAHTLEASQTGMNQEYWRYGFGAGAQIETGNSILKINYALGNPVVFKSAKIHFGVISYL